MSGGPSSCRTDGDSTSPGRAHRAPSEGVSVGATMARCHAHCRTASGGDAPSTGTVAPAAAALAPRDPEDHNKTFTESDLEEALPDWQLPCFHGLAASWRHRSAPRRCSPMWSRGAGSLGCAWQEAAAVGGKGRLSERPRGQRLEEELAEALLQRLSSAAFRWRNTPEDEHLESQGLLSGAGAGTTRGLPFVLKCFDFSTNWETRTTSGSGGGSRAHRLGVPERQATSRPRRDAQAQGLATMAGGNSVVETEGQPSWSETLGQ